MYRKESLEKLFLDDFFQVIAQGVKRMVFRSLMASALVWRYKKVEENHRGYIRADSEQGKGYSFQIYLPL